MTASPEHWTADGNHRANGRHGLVITLENVEPAFYTGWKGDLRAAKHDKAAMIRLLESANFAVTELTDDTATRDRVREELEALAKRAAEGHHVVVYFSGHGATLPDLNNDEIGVLRDGAWCLWDGMIVDDELTEALTKFEEGVRVVLISDSCYVGTIVSDELLKPRAPEDPLVIDPRSSKLAPVDIGERVYEAQKDFYDPILMRPAADPADTAAELLIMAACRRGELARVGDDGSIFTGTIVRVWNDGEFMGTYARLFEEVSSAVTKEVSLQNPVIRVVTKHKASFVENERAFAVAPRSRERALEER